MASLRFCGAQDNIALNINLQFENQYLKKVKKKKGFEQT